MKTANLTKALIATLIVFTSVNASAQNILTNSDFNRGTTGWTNNNTAVEVFTENVYGGRSTTNFTAEVDVQVGLNQRVAITKGNGYQLTFKASRRTNGAPSTVGLLIRVTGDRSGTNYVNATRSFTNTSFAFSTFTYTFTIPTNSTDANVTVMFAANNNNTTLGVIMDDIQLISVSTNSALPVVFGSVKASVLNNKVNIAFTTEQENNNKEFKIERSSNGVNFETVGTIAGTNTTVTHQYSFIDVPSVAGTFQYRIRQIDFDGKSSYSSVMVVRLSTTNDAMKLFPTVATTQVNIAVSLTDATTLQIAIVDAKGRMVSSQNVNASTGAFQQSLNVANLSKGIYYVKVVNAQNTINFVQAFQK